MQASCLRFAKCGFARAMLGRSRKSNYPLLTAPTSTFLMRGLAHAGIIVLVDEVTAYQRELKHKLFRRLTTNRVIQN